MHCVIYNASNEMYYINKFSFSMCGNYNLTVISSQCNFFHLWWCTFIYYVNEERGFGGLGLRLGWVQTFTREWIKIWAGYEFWWFSSKEIKKSFDGASKIIQPCEIKDAVRNSQMNR